jgi:di/tricarboxylate transporter
MKQFNFCSYVTDTTAAIMILLVICAWPKTNPFKCDIYEPLLTWKDIEKQFAWKLIFLLGGAFALAQGCEVI